MFSDAVIAGAKAGAVGGLIGGAFPFVAGLFAREYKKGTIGLVACVLLGSLFGSYAVIPMSLGSLVSIMRAKSERDEALGGEGLVFKYGPVFAVLTLVALPLIGLMALFLLGLAVFTIVSSRSSLGLRMSSVILGLLGGAFGWLVLLGIRQWYVPLSEYTLTDEGVTTKFRSSSVFYPWGSLSSAKHRTAMKQIDLEFEGSARRVVLGNVDFDPQQAKVLRALALVERSTGRTVTRTKF